MFSLKGHRALVVGIANESSIAWGCAQALKAQGAQLAVTYLNAKAEPYVRPLAEQVGADLILPLDVSEDAQLDAVFAAIADRWGRLDALLHAIAFCPKDDLHGRVVDVQPRGFRAGHGHLGPFLHPHGQARRAADARWRNLHDGQLSGRGARHRPLQRDGAGEGRAGIGDALSRRRTRAQGHLGPCAEPRPAAHPRGQRHRAFRRAARRGRGARADASSRDHRGCRAPIAPSSPRARRRTSPAASISSTAATTSSAEEAVMSDNPLRPRPPFADPQAFSTLAAESHGDADGRAPAPRRRSRQGRRPPDRDHRPCADDAYEPDRA
jgi:hypothetical protein